MTGAGLLSAKVPRLRDRSDNVEQINWSSKIIPPYLKKAGTLEEFIPFLYLKGVSTNDFSEVLSKLVGSDVELSASSIVRLKKIWEDEFLEWSKRDLSDKEYIYWWADGVYPKVRLEKEKPCLLVIMGARLDGTKEAVAIVSGYRESKESWKEVMLDLKNQGLKEPPKLAIGDGALGFWSAISEVFPETKHQRCWFHKMGNILDKMPKKIQAQAKKVLHEIYLAETKDDALKAFDKFIDLFEAKYPKAVKCLVKDKESTLTFYDFPAEHWRHIRTTNVIESVFATVKLRTYKTKGAGSAVAAVAMAWKLFMSASKRWHKINSYKKLILVKKGEKFKDGLLVDAA